MLKPERYAAAITAVSPLLLSVKGSLEMPTRKEIEDQIAALQAEADSMSDESDDFEVEIWNEKGEGARLPHSQSRTWLESKFPELFPAAPDSDGTSDSESDSKSGTPKQSQKKAPGNSGSRSPSTATKYFGKRTPNR